MRHLNDNWEFSVLGIYNYRLPGKLDFYLKYIKENHKTISGDLIESGVFRGASLISIAMYLKEIGSDKKVFGYDSFSGFPPIYDEKDNISEFEKMFLEKRISKKHFEDVHKSLEYRKILQKNNDEVKDLSSSLDFSQTSLELIQKKIEYLELDNIVIVDGAFSETMSSNSKSPEQIFGGIIDSDLYGSYLTTLEFVWPRSVSGALFYLDEYYSLKFPGARRACDEFMSNHKGEFLMNEPIPGDFERWYLKKN